MKLNDPLLAVCNGDPARFLALSDEAIIAHGKSHPELLQHTALSEEHRQREIETAKKKLEKDRKKLLKLAELDAKQKKKDLLAAMTPEQRKEWKKKERLEKQLANEPKLL